MTGPRVGHWSADPALRAACGQVLDEPEHFMAEAVGEMTCRECSEAFRSAVRAPDDDPVGVLTEVLSTHYAVGGWAAKAGIPGKPGRWSCACGANGPVPNGTRVVHHHREHLATEQAKALGLLP